MNGSKKRNSLDGEPKIKKKTTLHINLEHLQICDIHINKTGELRETDRN